MDITPLIGKWKRYPQEAKLFKGTFWVLLKSQTELTFQLDTKPDSSLAVLYRVNTSLKEFSKFIQALSRGTQYRIIDKGFFTKQLKVLKPNTLSETLYLWKIPIDSNVVMVSPETIEKLSQDFTET